MSQPATEATPIATNSCGSLLKIDFPPVRLYTIPSSTKVNPQYKGTYAQLRNHLGPEKCPIRKIKLPAHTMSPAQNHIGKATAGLACTMNFLSCFFHPNNVGKK